MSVKKEIDLSELAELMAESPAGLEKLKKQSEAIKTLQEALMLSYKRKRPYKIPMETDGAELVFGVVSDTHFGSGYMRLDALREFYQYCKKCGVAKVLHAGDVIDGWGVYKGQEFELHPYSRSWPEQREMFAKEAPLVDGIETIFITGNHDASFKKVIGMIVGDELQRVRSDWKHVGADVAVVTFSTKYRNFSIQLIHPGDGMISYSVSYKMQRIVESIPPNMLPDMIIIGHYHKAIFMPEYRGTIALCAGCFQGQTPYFVTKSIQAHVGGWVVRVVLGGKRRGAVRINTEFVSFRE